MDEPARGPLPASSTPITHPPAPSLARHFSSRVRGKLCSCFLGFGEGSLVCETLGFCLRARSPGFPLAIAFETLAIDGSVVACDACGNTGLVHQINRRKERTRPPLKSMRACGPSLSAPLTPAGRFAATPFPWISDLFFEICPFPKDKMRLRGMIQRARRSLQRPESPVAAMFELV